VIVLSTDSIVEKGRVCFTAHGENVVGV
jgi:hypothetical protein